MSGILEPKVTFQIIPASQLAGVTEQKVLIVGQMLSGGTATAGDLYTDIQNDNSWDTLFGKRSQIAGMIRNFKRENGISRIDAIPLDDAGAATAGTGVITFVGTASEDASLNISIGSHNDHRVQVDVLSTDSETDVADAVTTAFALDLTSPFIVANVAGVLTATAENAGLLCNDWSIEIDGLVAGMVPTITGWTGGATDPTLTSILDVIGEIRYQTIVWPSSYSLDVVETLLNARFNSDNQILDGIAVQAKKGTLASLEAYAVQNSQSVVVVGNKTVSRTALDGTMVVEMPDTMASEIAGIRSLRLTQDALLADILTTVATKDQFGGIGIASLPYFNTLTPNIAVPDEQDQWTLTEQDELRDNAVSILGANRAFNGVILGEFVTTYLTDEAGNPDTSFKFLNTVDTSSVIREFYYENSRSKYSQTRLTDGDLIAGRDMANAASIRAFYNELYQELAEDALVQAGTTAQKDFNDNLVIETNISTGTATVSMAPLLVTQLRAIIGTIQVNFGG